MYINYLFDVDGTLLPMNTQEFAQLYLKSICIHIAPKLGVDSKAFGNAVWAGTLAMMKNDGSMRNDKVFWNTMTAECGADPEQAKLMFEKYYSQEFDEVRSSTSVNPFAKKSVELIKSNGGRLIAATNPIFPKEATYKRLEWAGLEPNDFEFVTVYDNSHYCKPSLSYYEDVRSHCIINPSDSIMIGNDVDEDMVAQNLGFDTYLVTDCLINRSNSDISKFNNGSFEEFYQFLKNQYSEI